VRNSAKIFVITAAGGIIAATIGVTGAETGNPYFAVGIATGVLLNSLSSKPFVR
jgi:hypothetical protein